MAEDTSLEGTGNEPADTEADDASSKTPAQDTATSATSTAADAKSPDGGESSEPLDPQLIALCVLLWVAALGLLVVKWPSLRADWYLGDIMEAINLRGDFDQEAMDQLAAMGPGVVPHLKDEVHGASFNRDEIYRIAVVKILERIEGHEALEVLLLTARDVDPRVRANTYLSLKTRALEHDDEREAAIDLLAQMAQTEPEPVAQSYALMSLDELGALDRVQRMPLSWQLITVLRDARSNEALHAQLRESSLRGLRLLSGKDEEELPYEAEAAPEERDLQVKAWEAWYVAEGGEVPEGQDWDAWKSRLDEAATNDQAQDGDGAGATPTDEPGAQAPQAPVEQGSE